MFRRAYDPSSSPGGSGRSYLGVATPGLHCRATIEYDARTVHLIGSGKLSPPHLVESLVEASSEQLDQLAFGSMLLLIRAPDDDVQGHFMADLVRCALKEVPPHLQHGGWMTTSEFPTVSAKLDDTADADQIELLAELMAAPYCLVPLRGFERALEIGRSAGADILLNDPSVSSRHAQLLIGDGGTRIVDLGSKNGTIVNNRRIGEGEQPWLQSMDRITFGRITSFVCDPRAMRGVLRQSVRISF